MLFDSSWCDVKTMLTRLHSIHTHHGEHLNLEQVCFTALRRTPIFSVRFREWKPVRCVSVFPIPGCGQQPSTLQCTECILTGIHHSEYVSDTLHGFVRQEDF